MNNKMVRLIKISLVTIFLFFTFIGLSYKFGRSIWHPIIVKIYGGKSINDVVSDIAIKKPFLLNYDKGKEMVIVAYKSERIIEVYYNGIKVNDVLILAASGEIGPKIGRAIIKCQREFTELMHLIPIARIIYH